jgi:hypothetical protein
MNLAETLSPEGEKGTEKTKDNHPLSPDSVDRPDSTSGSSVGSGQTAIPSSNKTSAPSIKLTPTSRSSSSSIPDRRAATPSSSNRKKRVRNDDPEGHSQEEYSRTKRIIHEGFRALSLSTDDPKTVPFSSIPTPSFSHQAGSLFDHDNTLHGHPICKISSLESARSEQESNDYDGKSLSRMNSKQSDNDSDDDMHQRLKSSTRHKRPAEDVFVGKNKRSSSFSSPASSEEKPNAAARSSPTTTVKKELEKELFIILKNGKRQHYRNPVDYYVDELIRKSRRSDEINTHSSTLLDNGDDFLNARIGPQPTTDHALSITIPPLIDHICTGNSTSSPQSSNRRKNRAKEDEEDLHESGELMKKKENSSSEMVIDHSHTHPHCHMNAHLMITPDKPCLKGDVTHSDWIIEEIDATSNNDDNNRQTDAHHTEHGKESPLSYYRTRRKEKGRRGVSDGSVGGRFGLSDLHVSSSSLTSYDSKLSPFPNLYQRKGGTASSSLLLSSFRELQNASVDSNSRDYGESDNETGIYIGGETGANASGDNDNDNDSDMAYCEEWDLSSHNDDDEEEEDEEGEREEAEDGFQVNHDAAGVTITDNSDHITKLKKGRKTSFTPLIKTSLNDLKNQGIHINSLMSSSSSSSNDGLDFHQSSLFRPLTVGKEGNMRDTVVGLLVEDGGDESNTMTVDSDNEGNSHSNGRRGGRSHGQKHLENNSFIPSKQNPMEFFHQTIEKQKQQRENSADYSVGSAVSSLSSTSQPRNSVSSNTNNGNTHANPVLPRKNGADHPNLFRSVSDDEPEDVGVF